MYVLSLRYGISDTIKLDGNPIHKDEELDWEVTYAMIILMAIITLLIIREFW